MSTSLLIIDVGLQFLVLILLIFGATTRKSVGIAVFLVGIPAVVWGGFRILLAVTIEAEMPPLIVFVVAPIFWMVAAAVFWCCGMGARRVFRHFLSESQKDGAETGRSSKS